MPKRQRSSSFGSPPESSPPTFLLQQLHRLHSKQSLCDVRLHFPESNTDLYAHKVVLACYSDVFETMFLSAGFRESSENVVCIKDIRAKTFRHVLQFMYTGTLAVPEEDLLELMKVAEMYNVKKLRSHCLSLQSKMITTKNCFEMLKGVELVGVREALDSTTAFITDHFAECLEASTDGFLQLPLHLLTLIIERDELNAKDEEVVFVNVVRWLRVKENRVFAKWVLPLVRYTSMKQDYIIHHILCDYALLEEFPILDKLVNDALEWFQAQQLPVTASAFRFRVNRRKYHRVDTRKVGVLNRLKEGGGLCLRLTRFALVQCWCLSDRV